MSRSHNSRRGRRNSPRYPCRSACAFCCPAIRAPHHEADVARCDAKEARADDGPDDACPCTWNPWASSCLACEAEFWDGLGPEGFEFA